MVLYQNKSSNSLFFKDNALLSQSCLVVTTLLLITARQNVKLR